MSQASVLKLPAASVVTRVDESVVAHWSDVASLSAAQVIGASESSVKSTCFRLHSMLISTAWSN